MSDDPSLSTRIRRTTVSTFLEFHLRCCGRRTSVQSLRGEEPDCSRDFSKGISEMAALARAGEHIGLDSSVSTRNADQFGLESLVSIDEDMAEEMERVLAMDSPSRAEFVKSPTPSEGTPQSTAHRSIVSISSVSTPSMIRHIEHPAVSPESIAPPMLYAHPHPPPLRMMTSQSSFHVEGPIPTAPHPPILLQTRNRPKRCAPTPPQAPHTRPRRDNGREKTSSRVEAS